MKKMIKTKAQILSEGRYDSFTRFVSRVVMKSLKETEGYTEDLHSYDLPYDITGEEVFEHESGISFELELTIIRTDGEVKQYNKRIPYHVNTFVSVDDVLVMEIIIDESFGKDYYEEIFYKINEDVRHEVEHYVQELANTEEYKDIYKDRQQPKQNTAEYETVFKHHMDPSEVEALVMGFHRRAKLEKKPLSSIMKNDLNKDIEKGNLNQEEADILFKTWFNYAKRRISNFK